MTPRCTPKPTMRRVHWSITTITQCVCKNSRFAPKQVKTPQTLLRVTKDRQPGRPGGVCFRLVPSSQNAAHHVLVDGKTEGQGDLSRDSWTLCFANNPTDVRTTTQTCPSSPKRKRSGPPTTLTV
jgi:hypothetical protein